MNKRFKNKFLIFLVLLFIFIFPLLIVSAAPNLEYAPMETLPGFEKTADFVTFISNVYKFGIWAVGICALIMIVIGGYMYAASGGNNASMEKAKGFITDAIVGLVLALLAYLILYVINPELVKIKMAAAVTLPTTPTVPGPPSSLPSSIETAAATLSANTNVTLSSLGDCKNTSGTAVSPSNNLSQAKNGLCSTTCNSTCKSSGTSCGGCVLLKKELLNAINTVGNTTPLTVSSLTGGQHQGSTHYSGKAADIVPSTNKSNWPATVSQFQSAGCSSFCDKGGKNVICTTADHIHVAC